MKKRALAFAAAVLAVCMLAGCGAPKTEAPVEEIPSQAQVEAAVQQQMRSVTVFLADENGAVLPVASRVPKVEGIAAATLSQLSTEGLPAELAAAGLKAVLPQGTKVELDINKKGLATLLLSREALSVETALQEQAMMACLVNTLLQFDTVKQVRVKVNGLEGEVLPFGTDISRPFTAFPFNRENPMGADTRTAAVATVYCLNEGGLLVPTGVYLNGEHTLDAAFGCMARGPEGGRGLTSALPQGARLLSATLTAGTATLEFSDELAQVLSDADGGNARLSAVTLTAMACPGVENVILNCGGETLAVSQSAAAAVNTVN